MKIKWLYIIEFFDKVMWNISWNFMKNEINKCILRTSEISELII